MPVFSYVRSMYHYVDEHKDEFSQLELDIMKDHCELSMSKKQLAIKYKDICEDTDVVLSRVERKLNRIRHKESRQKRLSEK